MSDDDVIYNSTDPVVRSIAGTIALYDTYESPTPQDVAVLIEDILEAIESGNITSENIMSVVNILLDMLYDNGLSKADEENFYIKLAQSYDPDMTRLLLEELLYDYLLDSMAVSTSEIFSPTIMSLGVTLSKSFHDIIETIITKTNSLEDYLTFFHNNFPHYSDFLDSDDDIGYSQDQLVQFLAEFQEKIDNNNVFSSFAKKYLAILSFYQNINFSNFSTSIYSEADTGIVYSHISSDFRESVASVDPDATDSTNGINNIYGYRSSNAGKYQLPTGDYTGGGFLNFQQSILDNGEIPDEYYDLYVEVVRDHLFLYQQTSYVTLATANESAEYGRSLTVALSTAQPYTSSVTDNFGISGVSFPFDKAIALVESVADLYNTYADTVDLYADLNQTFLEYWVTTYYSSDEATYAQIIEFGDYLAKSLENHGLSNYRVTKFQDSFYSALGTLVDEALTYTMSKDYSTYGLLVYDPSDSYYADFLDKVSDCFSAHITDFILKKIASEVWTQLSSIPNFSENGLNGYSYIQMGSAFLDFLGQFIVDDSITQNAIDGLATCMMGKASSFVDGTYGLASVIGGNMSASNAEATSSVPAHLSTMTDISIVLGIAGLIYGFGMAELLVLVYETLAAIWMAVGADIAVEIGVEVGIEASTMLFSPIIEAADATGFTSSEVASGIQALDAAGIDLVGEVAEEGTAAADAFASTLSDVAESLGADVNKFTEAIQSAMSIASDVGISDSQMSAAASTLIEEVVSDSIASAATSSGLSQSVISAGVNAFTEVSAELSTTAVEAVANTAGVDSEALAEAVDTALSAFADSGVTQEALSSATLSIVEESAGVSFAGVQEAIAEAAETANISTEILSSGLKVVVKMEGFSGLSGTLEAETETILESLAEEAGVDVQDWIDAINTVGISISDDVGDISSTFSVTYVFENALSASGEAVMSAVSEDIELITSFAEAAKVEVSESLVDLFSESIKESVSTLKSNLQGISGIDMIDSGTDLLDVIVDLDSSLNQYMGEFSEGSESILSSFQELSDTISEIFEKFWELKDLIDEVSETLVEHVSEAFNNAVIEISDSDELFLSVNETSGLIDKADAVYTQLSKLSSEGLLDSSTELLDSISSVKDMQEEILDLVEYEIDTFDSKSSDTAASLSDLRLLKYKLDRVSYIIEQLEGLSSSAIEEVAEVGELGVEITESSLAESFSTMAQSAEIDEQVFAMAIQKVVDLSSESGSDLLTDIGILDSDTAEAVADLAEETEEADILYETNLKVAVERFITKADLSIEAIQEVLDDISGLNDVNMVLQDASESLALKTEEGIIESQSQLEEALNSIEEILKSRSFSGTVRENLLNARNVYYAINSETNDILENLSVVYKSLMDEYNIPSIDTVGHFIERGEAITLLLTDETAQTAFKGVDAFLTYLWDFPEEGIADAQAQLENAIGTTIEAYNDAPYEALKVSNYIQKVYDTYSSILEETDEFTQLFNEMSQLGLGSVEVVDSEIAIDLAEDTVEIATEAGIEATTVLFSPIIEAAGATGFSSSEVALGIQALDAAGIDLVGEVAEEGTAAADAFASTLSDVAESLGADVNEFTEAIQSAMSIASDVGISDSQMSAAASTLIETVEILQNDINISILDLNTASQDLLDLYGSSNYTDDELVEAIEGLLKPLQNIKTKVISMRSLGEESVDGFLSSLSNELQDLNGEVFDPLLSAEGNIVDNVNIAFEEITESIEADILDSADEIGGEGSLRGEEEVYSIRDETVDFDAAFDSLDKFTHIDDNGYISAENKIRNSFKLMKGFYSTLQSNITEGSTNDAMASFRGLNDEIYYLMTLHLNKYAVSIPGMSTEVAEEATALVKTAYNVLYEMMEYQDEVLIQLEQIDGSFSVMDDVADVYNLNKSMLQNLAQYFEDNLTELDTAVLEEATGDVSEETVSFFEEASGSGDELDLEVGESGDEVDAVSETSKAAFEIRDTSIDFDDALDALLQLEDNADFSAVEKGIGSSFKYTKNTYEALQSYVEDGDIDNIDIAINALNNEINNVLENWLNHYAFSILSMSEDEAAEATNVVKMGYNVLYDMMEYQNEVVVDITEFEESFGLSETSIDSYVDNADSMKNLAQYVEENLSQFDTSAVEDNVDDFLVAQEDKIAEIDEVIDEIAEQQLGKGEIGVKGLSIQGTINDADDFVESIQTSVNVFKTQTSSTNLIEAADKLPDLATSLTQDSIEIEDAVSTFSEIIDGTTQGAAEDLSQASELTDLMENVYNVLLRQIREGVMGFDAGNDLIDPWLNLTSLVEGETEEVVSDIEQAVRAIVQEYSDSVTNLLVKMEDEGLSAIGDDLTNLLNDGRTAQKLILRPPEGSYSEGFNTDMARIIEEQVELLEELNEKVIENASDIDIEDIDWSEFEDVDEEEFGDQWEVVSEDENDAEVTSGDAISLTDVYPDIARMIALRNAFIIIGSLIAGGFGAFGVVELSEQEEEDADDDSDEDGSTQ